MDSVDVVLTGQVLEGTDLETAIEQFIGLTRIDRQKALRLLQSGEATVVKRGLSAEAGERYRAAFAAIGVGVVLRPAEGAGDAVSSGPPMAAPVQPASSPTAQEPDPDPSMPPVPPTSSEPVPVQAQAAAAGGEGKGPGNSTSGPQRAGDRPTPPPNAAALTPRQVPASHGWVWVREAADLYMEAQTCWTGMTLFLTIMMALVGLIPVLGSLVTVLTGPVFAGGMMLAAHQQRQGQVPEFASLFQGFRHNRKQLLGLGGLQLLLAFVLGVFAGIVVGVGAVAGRHGRILDQLTQSPLLLSSVGLVVVLAAMVMGMVASMAFWFGPCLVAITDGTPWASLKISFNAAMRNWSAVLVFGLVTLAALVVIMLVAVLVGMLFSFAIQFTPQIVIQVAILALLSPIIALFSLATYTAFRDIFLARD